MDYNCLLAHTSLVLPFQWAGPQGIKTETYVSQLLEHKIADAMGQEFDLWDFSTNLPTEVYVLVRLFDDTWDPPPFTFYSLNPFAKSKLLSFNLADVLVG